MPLFREQDKDDKERLAKAAVVCAPRGAQYFHMGGYFKRGRAGLMYRFADGEWYRTTIPESEITGGTPIPAKVESIAPKNMRRRDRLALKRALNGHSVK
jgi:hypothetical protein